MRRTLGVALLVDLGAEVATYGVDCTYAEKLFWYLGDAEVLPCSFEAKEFWLLWGH